MPPASLDPSAQTGVCDPEPGQANDDPGEVTIFCADSLVLSLRAIKTVTRQPILRLYFHRPACLAIPCTQDELSTATVTAWTASAAFSVELDSRLQTVGIPFEDAAATWPAAGSSVAPLLHRIRISGAPAEVARRTPYPYCGTAQLSDPPTVAKCFRDAVLAGRPAEMVEHLFATEGGAILWLSRYSGHGAIVRYERYAGQWIRQSGAMYLGIDDGTFDFEPWDGTFHRL
jgi:hypothetical protein